MGVAQSYLYYIPLVMVTVWYSNRSIWTAAALSLGYAAVTLFLAFGGYSLDPVLLFLFTMLYLWGMTAVTLFSSQRSVPATMLDESPLFFSLDPGSLEISRISQDLASRLGLSGSSSGNLLLSSLCADPDEAEVFSGLVGTGMAVARFETALRGRSGEEVPVLLSCVPGEEGCRCTVLDLSSLQLYREMDERAGAEAARWQDFTTTAAHELRTPLQPVLGYLSLLLDDRDYYGIRDEAAGMLGVCLENVDRERRIVNRMLELSLLESGDMKNRPVEVDLAALIREVLDSPDFVARAEYRVAVPEGMTALVDRDQFFQVLEGLVSNAVEYGGEQKIVEISCGQEGRRQWVRVRDNGPGIDPAKQRMIFEPFSIGDGEMLSRRYGRMGLGLPIAERYARQNGGRIEMESTPGEGSTFTIVLERRNGGET
ncbi:sensor histidine kinase [Methanofollis formosanus]|uniref:sensor histidine kinase n=1 Tax=Methanofollis formosanus TaxID=299308 RepID=UPI001C7E09C5|nr:HAMP domain-containing sensor histidine kinase [Methanofollis formosanus]